MTKHDDHEHGRDHPGHDHAGRDHAGHGHAGHGHAGHGHAGHGHAGHAHGGHHHAQPDQITRAFVIGMLLNVVFVVIGVIAGLAAHSTALLADAAHNLGDVLGLGMAWG